jgi:hypothetical protein
MAQRLNGATAEKNEGGRGRVGETPLFIKDPASVFKKVLVNIYIL